MSLSPTLNINFVVNVISATFKINLIFNNVTYFFFFSGDAVLQDLDLKESALVSITLLVACGT